MAETQNTGQFAKTIVTDVGKDMIAKSQNGQTLTFSRVALGDGLVGEEEDATKFTAVKNERLSLPIAKYSNLGNGQFQIQFRLTNSQVESGFWHREIGIMAKIDNGQEQLYAYTTAGNKASFIYDKTTPVEERIVNVNFVIGNAQNLEVIINSSVIYATIEDLEEALDAHDAGADAHEPAFDAHNAADDAHKDFTGATAKAAGKRGMVPAPAAGDQNKALFGDKSYKSVVQSINGITPDAGGNVTVPTYTHPNSGVKAGTYRSVTVNAQGHVIAGSNPTITVAQGGTGATTVAAARNALGLGNTSGAVPVANGGTGATTAANARTNLGLSTAIINASISGKTITLTKVDGTKITLTTQDTAPFTGRATAIGGASVTKPAVIVETYQSGDKWYRIWSDGWIEQGASVNMVSGGVQTNLLKPYANTNWTFIIGQATTDNENGVYAFGKNKTATGLLITATGNGGHYAWYACGKGA